MTNLPELDPARRPELLFADIMAYIEKAEELVTARDSISLGGLNDAVAVLCTRIVEMQPEQSKEFGAELEKLMERLSALQSRMTALQGELTTTIKSLNKSQKANRAYINAPAAPGSSED